MELEAEGRVFQSASDTEVVLAACERWGQAAPERLNGMTAGMKRALVETIVQAAKEAYKNTGYNEMSILSLSTSDYPHFEELVL